MGGSHPPPPECGYYPYGEPPRVYIGRFQYRDKILRFEFDIGDLVECVIERNTSNLSMHEARVAHLGPPHTIPGVVISKRETDLKWAKNEMGPARKFVYTVRRIDGKVVKLRDKIYPIGHFKDEV